MTKVGREALRRVLGGKTAARATTDDLQGLLLQVVFALLMIFMIAYFIFVEQQKRTRNEEVMVLNRQKLTLALDKVAEDRRVRYGLNALMVQGVDGRRVFDPDTLVSGSDLTFAPAAKQAFAAGGKQAFADYSEPVKTAEEWRRDVLTEAGLRAAELSADEAEWFEQALAERIEGVRVDVRGVQRALAARVQRQWIADPSAFREVADPCEIADQVRRRSLKFVADALGSEVLP